MPTSLFVTFSFNFIEIEYKQSISASVMQIFRKVDTNPNNTICVEHIRAPPKENFGYNQGPELEISIDLFAVSFGLQISSG